MKASPPAEHSAAILEGGSHAFFFFYDLPNSAYASRDRFYSVVTADRLYDPFDRISVLLLRRVRRVFCIKGSGARKEVLEIMTIAAEQETPRRRFSIPSCRPGYTSVVGFSALTAPFQSDYRRPRHCARVKFRFFTSRTDVRIEIPISLSEKKRKETRAREEKSQCK